MAQKYVCDVCGKETGKWKGVSAWRSIFRQKTKVSVGMFRNEYNIIDSLDMCPDCFDEYTEMIEDWKEAKSYEHEAK